MTKLRQTAIGASHLGPEDATQEDVSLERRQMWWTSQLSFLHIRIVLVSGTNDVESLGLPERSLDDGNVNLTGSRTMPTARHTTQMLLLATSLGVALIGIAAVLYYGESPATRLGMGLLLLAVIMWVSARLGVVSRIAQSLSKGYKRRRYLKLRGTVDQFLEEVRRLNWAAAGKARGFRSEDEAARDLDALEKRMHELVGKIRDSAGHASPEPDEGPPL
jgi:hypothetical protein